MGKTAKEVEEIVTDNIELMKNTFITKNLKTFIREMVDSIEEQQGKFTGEDRKFWHGLVLSMTAQCAFEFAEEFDKQNNGVRDEEDK